MLYEAEELKRGYENAGKDIPTITLEISVPFYQSITKKMTEKEEKRFFDDNGHWLLGYPFVIIDQTINGSPYQFRIVNK